MPEVLESKEQIKNFKTQPVTFYQSQEHLETNSRILGVYFEIGSSDVVLQFWSNYSFGVKDTKDNKTD